MLTLKKAFSSTVGRKFLMAVSGIALVGFIIAHLAGNLTLFVPGGEAFNAYAAKLDALGHLKLVAEIGLIVLFGGHVFMAIGLKRNHRAARTTKYAKAYVSKGGNTHSTAGSRNMIITGAILLAFLILHIWQFRFGPAQAQGYVTKLEGEEVRDLYKLIVEVFKQPLFVAIYSGVMLMLGAHLRHGFWSAFQSLGALNPRYSKPINFMGLMIALVSALGFLGIPLYLYFTV